MLADRDGNDVSTYSQAALDRYNAALLLIRLYEGDPIAALDAALDDDPDFTMAWAARAAVLVQQADKAYDAEAERSLRAGFRSEEHTSELQSLMRISYAVFCLKKKNRQDTSVQYYHI